MPVRFFFVYLRWLHSCIIRKLVRGADVANKVIWDSSFNPEPWTQLV